MLPLTKEYDDMNRKRNMSSLKVKEYDEYVYRKLHCLEDMFSNDLVINMFRVSSDPSTNMYTILLLGVRLTLTLMAF